MKCPNCGSEKFIFVNTQEVSELVESHIYYCKDCKKYIPNILIKLPSNIPPEKRQKIVDELKKKVQSEGLGCVIER